MIVLIICIACLLLCGVLLGDGTYEVDSTIDETNMDNDN